MDPIIDTLKYQPSSERDKKGFNPTRIGDLFPLDHRRRSEFDFFLYEILGGRDPIPIIGTGLSDEFLFTNIAETTKPETINAYRQRLAQNVIMFTDRGHALFSPPGMTFMYSNTQIGIVEKALDSASMLPKGIAVGAFRVQDTQINGGRASIGVIGHLQGEPLTKENANKKFGYLRWREILIYYTEQLSFFFNQHNPSRPIDFLAIGEHPKSNASHNRVAKEFGYLIPHIDRDLIRTDTDTGRFYVKSAQEVEPNRVIQDILEFRFQEYIKKYGLHPEVGKYLEANPIE